MSIFQLPYLHIVAETIRSVPYIKTKDLDMISLYIEIMTSIECSSDEQVDIWIINNLCNLDDTTLLGVYKIVCESQKKETYVPIDLTIFEALTITRGKNIKFRNTISFTDVCRSMLNG